MKSGWGGLIDKLEKHLGNRTVTFLLWVLVVLVFLPATFLAMRVTLEEINTLVQEFAFLNDANTLGHMQALDLAAHAVVVILSVLLLVSMGWIWWRQRRILRRIARNRREAEEEQRHIMEEQKRIMEEQKRIDEGIKRNENRLNNIESKRTDKPL